MRDVELSDRAWAAIEAQRAHTQLAGKEIFWNPATGAPWTDIQSQWRIWQRCLKRPGLRYREPYQTRQTFAMLALMASANPSYIARQLGHTNANMLFRVYSKWIDGADKSRERDKLNVGFGHDLATELIAEARKFAAIKYLSGGERGIRTLDTGFGPYAPLAGECLRPLGHLSG